MDRRNFGKGLVAAGVALALPQAARARRGLGAVSSVAPAPFNYYISTTGSDSNTGSLSSPWAITAINSKQSTYAGLRVGLLPGTYDVSGLMLSELSGGNVGIALNINGGSSGAPTYIGSSDASGNYSPRTATLDAAARASFTASIAASTSCTFDISMAGGNSTTATLTNIAGTPQAGMIVSGITGNHGPVWLISGSGGSWTTSFNSVTAFSQTGCTGYVAAMTVSSVSGTIGVGAVLSVPGLASGALVTGGSGTSWTVGANVASTINAAGTSALYGGLYNSASWIIGNSRYPSTTSPANWGYWTLDGIIFTGFSQWAIAIGSFDASGGTVLGAIIQNCEFYGGDARYNCVSEGTNLAVLTNYTSLNALVTNNYIHDNIGWLDSEHFSALYVWGQGTGTVGFTFTYNTVVASGNVHQKEATSYNSEIAYNYVDMTGSNPLAIADQNAACIFGWNSDGGAGTLTKIHHNICISPNGQNINLTNDSGVLTWDTPCSVYNNTCVLSGNQYSAGAAEFFWAETTAGTRLLTYYNNLYYDNGYSVATNFGYTLVNTDAFQLADYNIYGAGAAYTTFTPGTHSGTEVNYATFAAYKTAVQASYTGAEGNSSTNSTNPFTNGGTFADQYQVQSGSPAYQTGKVGGVSGGAATNVGAWDGSGRPGASWVS